MQAQGNAVGISGERTEFGENDIRDTCLTHVHGIVAGETPNVRDLSFRDPDCFQFGQLRTRIRLWETILDGYEPATMP